MEALQEDFNLRHFDFPVAGGVFGLLLRALVDFMLIAQGFGYFIARLPGA